WPQPRNAEEVHDALLGLVAVDEAAVSDPTTGNWTDWLHELRVAGRAAAFETGDSRVWFPVEHLETVRLVYEGAPLPALDVPARALLKAEHREAARASVLRGHSEIAGVTTVEELAARTAL